MKKFFLSLSILLLFLSGCSSKPQSIDSYILKVNDTLYYGSDEVGPMGDSGCVEGEIQSSVKNDSIPSQNDESNFGCIGNAYTYDDGYGAIMVFLDDEEWHWFYSEKGQ